MEQDRLSKPGMTLLAVDVGRGTQDVLVYDPGRPVENCTKMVLPSPTMVVAQRIREAAGRGKDIFLDGYTMGGGDSVQAISEHLRKGLSVFATEPAALTIHDSLENSLEKVRSLGIQVVSSQPSGTTLIRTTDYMEAELRTALGAFGVPYPEKHAFAVQDHGFSPTESNRLHRFRVMGEVLEKGDWQIWALARDPPLPTMTRMAALRKQADGALVIDTGPAALLGALCDPWVKKRVDEGITLVNAGNAHTFCVNLHGKEVCGILEHHTHSLDRDHLLSLIIDERGGLQRGRPWGKGSQATPEQVSRGHGPEPEGDPPGRVSGSALW
ncbi:MAG: DUF1786 domain-containing protein [Methanomicrobiales archaeon]|nr:DUF1786 domain-containing protein [Methanomicrobiales archaeon]